MFQSPIFTPFMSNKLIENRKGQLRIDNLETLALLGTQDTDTHKNNNNKNTTQKTKKMSNMEATINRG